MKILKPLLGLIALAAITIPVLSQDQQPMSFFIASVGSGDGANLGGLAGADAHCQALASAAGRGNATWRAYLSQAPGMGAALVNARDRIGDGPWYNANGDYVAWDINGLHEDQNNMRKPSAVDENGDVVNGAGDSPNRHDILTGSDSKGNLAAGSGALNTCSNWTSNDAGSAIVGHHDRLGGPSASWNSVHSTRSCSQEDLEATGGDGLFYCFAAD
ncbi:MAG: lectin [Candidatus Rariloculaceae bacterium]